MDVPPRKLRLAYVALAGDWRSDQLRTQVSGALAVVLYLLGVASVLAGIVLEGHVRVRFLPV